VLKWITPPLKRIICSSICIWKFKSYLLAHLLLFLVIMQHWNIFFLRKILRLDWCVGFCYFKNLISQSKTRKALKMLSHIICQDWQQIRDLTSYQFMTTFLMNLYFMSLQCLGFLILLIFLFQDNCQLIGVPKIKESSWTKWRTFIGTTFIYSNIILIKYFENAFLIMR